MEFYSLQLVDHNSKAVSKGYHLGLVKQGRTVFEGITDDSGKIFVHSDLVKGRKVQFEFWGKEFEKGMVSITPEFLWDSHRSILTLKIPLVCEVELRETENTKNEKKDYYQAKHIVQLGDTWEAIAKIYNLDKQEIRLVQFYNQLPLDNSILPKAGDTLKLFKGARKFSNVDSKESKVINTRSCRTGHPEMVVLGEKRKPCFCHRDFTVDEFKNIVKSLRLSENLETQSVWIPRSKSGAAPDDKSFDTMVKQINRIMNKYEINTCIRKIHFLAQIYHETDRFYSTQEYKSNYASSSSIHCGRGLIHLTKEENYRRFANAMGDNEILINPKIVATKTIYAYESGGWYWKNGSAWGNLNKQADKDDIYFLNIGVNGGFFGFAERIKYIKTLIKVCNVKYCPNIFLNKMLGEYKFSISDIKGSRYGEKNKKKFEMYDD